MPLRVAERSRGSLQRPFVVQIRDGVARAVARKTGDAAVRIYDLAKIIGFRIFSDLDSIAMPSAPRQCCGRRSPWRDHRA